MHKTFNKIILESADNKTILIEPIQFYMLNDHSVKYVIMYKLMYIDNQNPSSNIESTIPYYISNGVTNKLRANMLYPFMCYSNVNDIKTCPFNFNRFIEEIDDGTVSILLKYNIGKNIKVIDLEEDQTESWADMLPGKPISPLVHQVILRDGLVNKNLPLYDTVPEKYQRKYDARD